MLRLHRGYDITKAQQSPGPYPVVSSSGISSWHSECKFGGPGVIIGRKGSLGTAFYIPGPYWPHDTTLYVEDFRGNSPRYCYYLLKTLGLERYDVGASNPTLNRNHLHEVDVTTPSAGEQRRIADVLSSYDDLIENNTRRVAILEEMARRIFEEWFVHFRAPGCEGLPLVESELGPIPKGWKALPLSEVAAVNPEQITPRNPPASINYIDIASVSPGSIDAVVPMDFSDAPGRARRIVRHGDVIWSTVRPNRRSFALVAHPLPDTIASTGFAVLRARDVPWAYLYCATTTQGFTDYLTNHATGSAYPAVKADDFEKAVILVPPRSVLADFAKLAEPAFSLGQTLRGQNRNLRAQRDLLLPKLISGEIEVADAAPMLEAAE